MRPNVVYWTVKAMQMLVVSPGPGLCVFTPPPPPTVYRIMTIIRTAMTHHWRQLICTCIYNAADPLAVATSSSFSGRSLSSGTAADDVWIRHFLALARSF